MCFHKLTLQKSEEMKNKMYQKIDELMDKMRRQPQDQQSVTSSFNSLGDEINDIMLDSIESCQRLAQESPQFQEMHQELRSRVRMTSASFQVTTEDLCPGQEETEDDDRFWNRMCRMFCNFFDWLSKVWQSICTWIKEKWESVWTWMKETWVWKTISIFLLGGKSHCLQGCL